MPSHTQHCAFVALIGAPNAGKSTLTNRLVGQKVSIVTPKVQTTRNRVCGITTHDNTQLVLMDTPGIFTPRKRLDRAMVASAWDGLAQADLRALLIDARKGLTDEVRNILDGLRERRIQCLLLLNKVDEVKQKDNLLGLASSLHETDLFTETFMISALTGDGVEDFRNYCVKHAPTGPWLYPEDQLTDIHERLLASEITREKLFLQLQKELPYSLTVETESWEDEGKNGIRINQVIYVEREGQKGIILGKGGQLIKKVGEHARQDLSRMMDCPVHLFLHVKVRKNWKNNPEIYHYLGLEFGQ